MGEVGVGLKNRMPFDEKKQFKQYLKSEMIEESLKYSGGLWSAYVVGPFWRIFGYK